VSAQDGIDSGTRSRAADGSKGWIGFQPLEVRWPLNAPCRWFVAHDARGAELLPHDITHRRLNAAATRIQP
jgi:hypothetical protein